MANAMLRGQQEAHRQAPPASPKSAFYPANLCPLSSGVEFAGLGEHLGQTVGESIKAAAGRAVEQGTPEHLDGVLSGQKGIGNAIQAGTR